MREPRWRTGDRDWGLPLYGSQERRAEIGRHLRSAIWLAGSVRRSRKVAASLRGREIVGLALGSGANPPPGWIGLDRYRSGADVFPADIRDRLPLRTASVPVALAEHVLEHLHFDELPAVVSEVRRILAPGGVFRIVCPDALFVARMLLSPNDPAVVQAVDRDARMHRWSDEVNQHGATVNRLSHQWGQHRSLLTAADVSDLLRRAGFVDVVELDVEQTALLDDIPDVHPHQFPDDPSEMNFAVEGRVS